MSKVQTDNDAAMFLVMVELRERLIQEKSEYKILESFAGDGALWGYIQKKYPKKKLNILRIDAKPDKKGIYLKGDNLKFMASMDLSKFDIIDLDAYGQPYEQLELVFGSKFHGPVVCTWIMSGTFAARFPLKMLQGIGITKKMYNMCPTLFSKNEFTKVKEYLALKGVKSIQYYSENRKNYFSFFI